MNAKDIQKKIQRHIRGKIILSMLMIVFSFCLCIGVVIKNSHVAIGAYLMLLVVIIIGYLYPVDQPLSKKPTIQDYKGILDYLANISTDTGKYTIYDGFVMIKKSLDDIAHYKLNGEEEYIKNNVYYLQGKFCSTDNKNFIPKELYDLKYLNDTCNKLLQQMENKMFDGADLDAIKSNNKQKIRKKPISHQTICNFLLVIFVIFKIVISISPKWYNIINEVTLLRVIYNTGTDVIAVVLALWAYLKCKEA